MDKVISIILRIAAIMVWCGPYGNSDAATIKCDNCSYAEMEQRAFDAANNAPVPYNDIVYYINSTSGLVGKFELFKDYSNPDIPCVPNPYEVTLGCLTLGFSVPRSVELEVQQFANYIRAVSSGDISVSANPDIPNNGYELTQYPQMQEAVAEYLRSTEAMFKQEFWNLSTYITGFGSFEVVVRVRLSDGGTATFRWNYEKMKFVYIKGTSKDSQGNPIPETQIDVAGGGDATSVTYDFTQNPETVLDFLHRMIDLGVPVTGPNSGRMICSSKVEGERVTVSCRAI